MSPRPAGALAAAWAVAAGLATAAAAPAPPEPPTGAAGPAAGVGAEASSPTKPDAAQVAGVTATVEASATSEAGPILTLSEARERAQHHNPAIASASEAATAAAYRVDMARFGFYPQLVLSLSYKRATMNSPMAPYMADLAASPATAAFASMLSRETWDNYDNFAASASLSQTLWDGMRTISSYKAAEDLAEGAQADQDTSRDTVCVQVTQAYFSALAAQQAVAAALETRRQMAEHERVAREQLAADVRQRIDVTRAQADLASANMTVARARNAYDLARLNLSTLMGSSAPAGFRLVRPSHGADEEIGRLDEAVAQARAARPELRALEAKARAAGHLVTAASSSWWPTVTASASWSHTGYVLSDLPFNWALGVTASWSALQGLYAYPAAREAEANERATRAAIANVELGIRADVESAWVSQREARERLVPADALVTSAKETLRLAEGRYQAGSGSIVEITDAQALYTQARLQVIQAELDLEVARARLRKALGKSTCGTEER